MSADQATAIAALTNQMQQTQQLTAEQQIAQNAAIQAAQAQQAQQQAMAQQAHQQAQLAAMQQAAAQQHAAAQAAQAAAVAAATGQPQGDSKMKLIPLSDLQKLMPAIPAAMPEIQTVAPPKPKKPRKPRAYQPRERYVEAMTESDEDEGYTYGSTNWENDDEDYAPEGGDSKRRKVVPQGYDMYGNPYSMQGMQAPDAHNFFQSHPQYANDPNMQLHMLAQHTMHQQMLQQQQMQEEEPGRKVPTRQKKVDYSKVMGPEDDAEFWAEKLKEAKPVKQRVRRPKLEPRAAPRPAPILREPPPPLLNDENLKTLDRSTVLKKSSKEPPSRHLKDRIDDLDGRTIEWALKEYYYESMLGNECKYDESDLKYDVNNFYLEDPNPKKPEEEKKDSEEAAAPAEVPAEVPAE